MRAFHVILTVTVYQCEGVIKEREESQQSNTTVFL